MNHGIICLVGNGALTKHSTSPLSYFLILVCHIMVTTCDSMIDEMVLHPGKMRNECKQSIWSIMGATVLALYAYAIVATVSDG